MNEQETSADIIAEKRFDATTRDQFDSAYIVDFCDRLEAALKRERGDCAKLRKALEFIKQYFDKIDPFNINTYTFSQIEVDHINENITAALAAPQRNCEVGTEASHKCETATAEKTSVVGDAAKLREALLCIGHIAEYLEAGTVKDLNHAYRNIQDRVGIALSAPPRNCDKYSHDEALQVWASEKSNEHNGCFDVWLYEVAKEGDEK